MKRPITALGMPGVVPGTPATKPPVVMKVRPSELLVDSSYQRDLSDQSLRLIRRIVAEWDWRKYKAPCVAMTDEGPVVLDGQHTATAAASHPGIAEIPVLVVEAPEQRDQAEAFVGLNVNRLAMTAAQIHAANVTAGDGTALAVDRACAAAGIRVLRLPPARAIYKVGETIAVAALAALVGRHGEEKAAEVLRILAAAEYGPIAAAHVRAVEAILTDPEFAELSADDLARIVRELGIEAAEKEAKAFAATHGLPLWRALAAVWFKARRARRKASASEEQPARKSPVASEKASCPQDLSGGDDTRSAAEEFAPSRQDLVSDNAARAVDQSAPEFAASGAKRDARPARNGWQPGPMLRRCSGCDAKFTGGLRASTCADCAYGQGRAA